LIFVAMNDFQNQSARHHRRPCRTEVQLHLPAISAFKSRSDVTFIR
jgi:hypothetical protein